jgi:hypothetical protein
MSTTERTEAQQPIPAPKHTKQPVEGRLTFPPWPQAPEGANIIPFSKFKERGIQIFATEGDDMERDGLGIPTIELRVRHDTDVCKTDAKRKMNAKSTAQQQQMAPAPPRARKEWWEQWMEVEDLRVTSSYNP